MWKRPDWLSEQITALDVQEGQNAPRDFLARASGFRLEKIITLDANNASDVKNVFTFDKNVRILAMHLEVASVTTMTNCTGVYFDTYDGTAAVVITADGATLSNCGEGTFALKDQDSTQPLTTAQCDQVRVIEPSSGKKSHQPFIVTGKNGATNYIRLHYTTTDTPINADLLVSAEYVPINGGSIEVI